MGHYPSWEADSSYILKSLHLLSFLRFITVFVASHHWLLSWTSRIHSTHSHCVALQDSPWNFPIVCN